MVVIPSSSGIIPFNHVRACSGRRYFQSLLRQHLTSQPRDRTTSCRHRDSIYNPHVPYWRSAMGRTASAPRATVLGYHARGLRRASSHPTPTCGTTSCFATCSFRGQGEQERNSTRSSGARGTNGGR